MIKLKDFRNHIDKVPTADWDILFGIIPRIEECDSFGELGSFEKDADGVAQFPVMNVSDVVSDFEDIMYKLTFVVDFDWGKWSEGKAIVEKREYKNQDTITLVKILAAFIRQDRFNDGFLVGKFEDGAVLDILRELQNNLTN